MNHVTKCKFCHKEIVLTIDDTYAALRDPFKLMRLAGCNRCADFRVLRDRLNDQIQKLCFAVTVARESNKDLQSCRDLMDVLTKKYSKMVADFYSATPVWEKDFSDMLMDNPQKSFSILKTFRDNYRQIVKDSQRELVEA